jgi:hypothetical protein
MELLNANANQIILDSELSVFYADRMNKLKIKLEIAFVMRIFIKTNKKAFVLLVQTVNCLTMSLKNAFAQKDHFKLQKENVSLVKKDKL